MIDPSVTAVLRTKYTIRQFYTVFSIIFFISSGLSVALSLGDFVPQAQAILASFFGSLSGTILTVMAIYGVWIFVTPPEIRHAVILPLRPKEISEFLEQIRTNSTQYVFWGRSGTSFRQNVLPTLDNRARSLRQSQSIKVVMPNPAAPSISSNYATMINGLGENANDKTLLVSVVAMALDLAIRSSENVDLRVEMCLCPTLPVVRMDISDQGAVITRDAKSLPGIYCGPGSQHLDMYRTMAENEFRQGKPITWTQGIRYRDIRSASEIAMHFPALPTITDELMIDILEILETPKSRYVA